MIVPSARLLLWTSVVAVPAIALPPLIREPAVALGCAVAAMLYVAAVVIDAARCPGTLRSLSMLPQGVQRFIVGRPGDLRWSLKCGANLPRRLSIAWETFEETGIDSAAQKVVLPDGEGTLELTTPACPTARGAWPLLQYRLEAPSPWGLWDIREARPADGEIRAYPDMSHQRQAAARFLTRNALGSHARRSVGKGRDFEKLRDYLPGDSLDEIHWRATAKRMHPVTKVFQIERTQEIYVVLDFSRLMARTLPKNEADVSDKRPVTLLERSITAGLLLGAVAQKQGDLFGLVTFADRPETIIPARAGRAHYQACRDAIFALKPRSVVPDFADLFSFLRTRLRKRCLLLIVTALDDPASAESFLRTVGIVARKHLVVVTSLRPPGAVPMFDGEPVENLAGVYRRLAGQMAHQHLREIELDLHRIGVGFRALDHEGLATGLVDQYMDVKRRQIL